MERKNRRVKRGQMSLTTWMCRMVRLEKTCLEKFKYFLKLEFNISMLFGFFQKLHVQNFVCWKRKKWKWFRLSYFLICWKVRGIFILNICMSTWVQTTGIVENPFQWSVMCEVQKIVWHVGKLRSWLKVIFL